MSLKLILSIVVLIVLGGAVYVYTTTRGTPQAPVDTTVPSTATIEEVTTQPAPLPTASSDVSDAAIATDVAAIDAQMTGLALDVTSVGQSVNDTPIAQQ